MKSLEKLLGAERVGEILGLKRARSPRCLPAAKYPSLIVAGR